MGAAGGGGSGGSPGGEDAGEADVPVTDVRTSRGFYIFDPVADHALRPGEDPTLVSRDTYVSAVSADGSVVVGVSMIAWDQADGASTGGTEAFRWTEATGV